MLSRSVLSRYVGEMLDYLENNIDLYDKCVLVMPDIPEGYSFMSSEKVMLFKMFDEDIFRWILKKQQAQNCYRIFIGVNHNSYTRLNTSSLVDLFCLPRSLNCFCWLVVPVSERSRLCHKLVYNSDDFSEKNNELNAQNKS